MPEKPFDCCISLGKAFDSETVVIGNKTGPAWDFNKPKGATICRTGLSGYSLPGYQMYDAGNLETCIRMVAGNRLPFMIGERYSIHEALSGSRPEIAALFTPPIVVASIPFHFYISKALTQSPFDTAIRKAFVERKMSDSISRRIHVP